MRTAISIVMLVVLAAGSGWVGAQGRRAVFSEVRAGTLTLQTPLAAQYGGVPTGAVIFVTTAACPSGYSAYATAQGRYVVGLPSGGTLEGTQGTALSNQENRAVGHHDHGVTDPGHAHPARTRGTFGRTTVAETVDNVHARSVSTVVGDATTGMTVDTAGETAGTPAPYVQLRACQRS